MQNISIETIKAYSDLIRNFDRETASLMVEKFSNADNACRIDAAWFEYAYSTEDDTFVCSCCA